MLAVRRTWTKPRVPPVFLVSPSEEAKETEDAQRKYKNLSFLYRLPRKVHRVFSALTKPIFEAINTTTGVFRCGSVTVASDKVKRVTHLKVVAHVLDWAAHEDVAVERRLDCDHVFVRHFRVRPVTVRAHCRCRRRHGASGRVRDCCQLDGSGSDRAGAIVALVMVTPIQLLMVLPAVSFCEQNKT